MRNSATQIKWLIAAAILTGGLVAFAADESKDDEKDHRPGLVRCANLIYGRDKSSNCYADHFLADIQKQTNIWTASHFSAVKLESDQLYQFPFAVMSGEGAFTFTEPQRKALRQYLLGGGFLVASAGCSNQPWNSSFEREIAAVFPEFKLETIPIEHPVFHTVYDIKELKTKSKSVQGELKGMIVDGRIALIYSSQGLNDTANAGGNCCCCGGNEILNARQVNVNLLAYALTH